MLLKTEVNSSGSRICQSVLDQHLGSPRLYIELAAQFVDPTDWRVILPPAVRRQWIDHLATAARRRFHGSLLGFGLRLIGIGRQHDQIEKGAYQLLKAPQQIGKLLFPQRKPIGLRDPFGTVPLVQALLMAPRMVQWNPSQHGRIAQLCHSLLRPISNADVYKTLCICMGNDVEPADAQHVGVVVVIHGREVTSSIGLACVPRSGGHSLGRCAVAQLIPVQIAIRLSGIGQEREQRNRFLQPAAALQQLLDRRGPAGQPAGQGSVNFKLVSN